jgi:alkanesulfonate monooxygenase SsuD/methylene tetrahydromethanopterin reductase-like flavin-dependent oxidoreductase (luciferase family)
MLYGVNLPNGGVDPQTLAEFALLAEQAGWDGVFLEDYIVWQGDQDTPTYDVWVALAAMAVRTERIRLGTMVTPLARRRPWKVARETVTLDHLSNGRLILGVGLGDTISDDVSFTHFGEEMDVKRRARMLDEAFAYQGEYYHVQAVKLLPKPVQTPRIPIWVGGGYPLKGPMRRAAHWDGSCLYKHHEHYMMPEDVRALKAYVEKERGTLDGFDIAIGGSSRRADWEEERGYIQSLAEAGVTWWMEYVPPNELGVMRACVERGPLRIDWR